jgi:hypothetical protein
MKFLRMLTLTLLLLSPKYAFCADANIHDSLFEPLTETEDACFNWFEANKQILRSIYQTLSQEDKNIMTNKVLYKDNPVAVTKCLSNYVKNFFELYTQKLQKDMELEEIAIPYDFQTTIRTVLKIKILLQSPDKIEPRNITEARILIFKSLSPEEKETVYEKNYLANPQATYAAMTKSGHQLANYAVQFKLIKDTPDAKEKFANEWRDKKMAALERAYRPAEETEESVIRDFQKLLDL